MFSRFLLRAAIRQYPTSAGSKPTLPSMTLWAMNFTITAKFSKLITSGLGKCTNMTCCRDAMVYVRLQNRTNGRRKRGQHCGAGEGQTKLTHAQLHTWSNVAYRTIQSRNQTRTKDQNVWCWQMSKLVFGLHIVGKGNLNRYVCTTNSAYMKISSTTKMHGNRSHWSFSSGVGGRKTTTNRASTQIQIRRQIMYMMSYFSTKLRGSTRLGENGIACAIINP